MNEIIKQLVKTLLTKELFIDNAIVSFTANLNDIIHEYKHIPFNETSANIIFEIVNNEVINNFNLTIKIDKGYGVYPLDWYQSKYIFYGENNKKFYSIFDCLSNISKLDNYNRLVKDNKISIENLSKHIDLLIELDLMLIEQRKSIIEHLEKINTL